MNTLVITPDDLLLMPHLYLQLVPIVMQRMKTSPQQLLMNWYGLENPYHDRQLCIHMVLDNSATGLPTPAQEPVYEPIYPQWHLIDDTGNDISDLIDIPKEVLFWIKHLDLGSKLYLNITKRHTIFLTKGKCYRLSYQLLDNNK